MELQWNGHGWHQIKNLSSRKGISSSWDDFLRQTRQEAVYFLKNMKTYLFFMSGEVLQEGDYTEDQQYQLISHRMHNSSNNFFLYKMQVFHKKKVHQSRFSRRGFRVFLLCHSTSIFIQKQGNESKSCTWHRNLSEALWLFKVSKQQ